MGLDIYLYRHENFDEAQRREQEYEEKSEAIWDEIQAGRSYEGLSESEKDRAREGVAVLAREMGLGSYGEALPPLKEKIERDDERFPDHLFKIGYFRSSYNDGGIDHVLGNALGKQALYWIFAPEETDLGPFVPDWMAARERARALRSEWESYLDAHGSYRVLEVSSNPFVDPKDLIAKDEGSALALFLHMKEKNAGREGSGWFSNRDGHYFLSEPARVRALLVGTRESYMAKIHNQEMLEPAVYAIYDADRADMEWYTQALQIVEETCRWVLDTGEPEKYVLSWSG